MGRSNRGSGRRAPAIYKSAQPAVSTRKGESGGFLANVYGGLSSGLGFGVAQRIVEGIFGPRHIETVQAPNAVAARNVAARDDIRCDRYADELQQCTLNNPDISLCQPFVESLKMCRQGLTF